MLLSLTAISIHFYPENYPRRLGSIVLDVTTATIIIYYTGGATSPAFLLYIWLLSSNAIRFGRREVIASQILSLIGFLLILIFSADEIKDRLENLPCVFKNQTFRIKRYLGAFENIIKSKAFTFELSTSKKEYPRVYGELIDKDELLS